MDDITDFLLLYWLCVRTVMIAIQIADFFILKQEHSSCSYRLKNLTIWLIGFLLYRC